jgi:protoporphyrinogen oxidase
MARHIIIGAGPTGLTAAWQLTEQGKDVLVLESDPLYVGGIARSVEYKGNFFDMGGHRFYSKNDEINRLWRQMLDEPFIEVPRLSRIYYKKHFFPYPIRIKETLKGLGFWESLKIVISFLKARIFIRNNKESFENWMVNRFGYRLYSTFFKTYSEKVWGIPCSEMNKDWAVQRMRGLSLFEVIKDTFFRKRAKDQVASLINSFIYPRKGPGQIWEAVRDKVVALNGQIKLNKNVIRLNHQDGIMTSVYTQDGGVYTGDYFYISMALKDFAEGLNPQPPKEILTAARSLRYRDFIIVALIINKDKLFPDNWIYIHDPDVYVSRIQNYKNWSIDMQADRSQTCLGMEYFCNRGDWIWNSDDEALIKIAVREIHKIALADSEDCVDACVVRIPNAYPVYDREYKANLQKLKDYFNSYFKNVFPAGRSGLHNYNSMDHSMMTAILSVKNMNNINNGGRFFDVWAINTDEEYGDVGNFKKKIEEKISNNFKKLKN